jgi:hypothetical protein
MEYLLSRLNGSAAAVIVALGVLFGWFVKGIAVGRKIGIIEENIRQLNQRLDRLERNWDEKRG